MNANHAAAAKPRRGYSPYQKLFFLYALNLCDWLCTAVLLKSGRFYEANPLMSPILPHFFPTLLLKGLLPLALTVACAVLFKLTEPEDFRFASVMLNIAIIAYSLLNLWHILNFLLLFTAF